jgi:hypothetical protein
VLAIGFLRIWLYVELVSGHHIIVAQLAAHSPAAPSRLAQKGVARLVHCATTTSGVPNGKWQYSWKTNEAESAGASNTVAVNVASVELVC